MYYTTVSHLVSATVVRNSSNRVINEARRDWFWTYICHTFGAFFKLSNTGHRVFIHVCYHSPGQTNRHTDLADNDNLTYMTYSHRFQDVVIPQQNQQKILHRHRISCCRWHENSWWLKLFMEWEFRLIWPDCCCVVYAHDVYLDELQLLREGFSVL